MAEETLPGGFVNLVVRSGETVRRRPGPRADYVHRLLRFFGEAGWHGAPRFVGIDPQGRETLDYVDGYVPWPPGQLTEVSGDQCLLAVGALVREFHDLTVGTELSAGAEVVCHNDLSPRNTVYRDVGSGYRPVALIDWDIAGPGQRIHDIGHLCWQYAGLGPTWNDLAEAGRRVRVLCDGYGLTDRGAVIDAILWWQDRCWRGIFAAAAAGHPAMVRLRDTGATASVRAQYDWVAAHRRELAAALR